MADTSYTIALDIFARRGKRPILIAVDAATSDYSIYELGAAPDADTVAEIIEALEREIEIAEECPVAIETDHSIHFSSDVLHRWLFKKGIVHRYRPLAPIVEALIRQHAPEWA